MIALEAVRRHLVAMLGTTLFDAAESGADFHALDRIDAHHGAGQIGVETLEHRLAPSRRHSGGDDRHARTDGIAGLADPPDEILEFLHPGWIRTKEGVLVCRG